MLRARERLPQLRPANRRFDGLFAVPSLEDILSLVRAKEAETGRSIGVYPETKHPSHFANSGLPHGPPLLRALERFGYASHHDPIFVQSFEPTVLEELHRSAPFRLIQLIAAEGGPADRPELSYAAMSTPEGLHQVSRYAAGIGPDKALILPPGADRQLPAPTPLVSDAHRAGLLVHPWTLRQENCFLPPALRIGNDPAAPGDLSAELAAVLDAGIDGLFCDHPGAARLAIDRWMACRAPAR